MKVILATTALAVASGLWAAANPAAQDAGDDGTRGGLVRVEPEADFDAQVWRERLTQPDLAERERAFGELVEQARQERDAEDALETWSRGAGELAWTARLALRELRRTGGALRPQTAPFRGDPFGGDPFLRDFFGPDPFGRGRFGGAGDPFEAMRQRMQRMLEEFHGSDPFGGLDRDLDLRSLPPGASSRSQSFQLRQTPDGVEVEITEDDGEGPSKRTYRAPSLEELYDAHPELRDRIGVQRLESGAPFGRGLRDFLREVRPPEGPALEGPSDGPPPQGLRRADDTVTRTDKLGVYFDPEVAEGEFVIEGVEPGTIASALRLRAGDVLLELNGTEVSSAEDIRRALEIRFPDEDVRVLVRTATGAEEELVWTPE